MPDCSPIDLWWKSHLPAKVTTTPKHAVHAPRSAADPRPYCGHRDRNAMILSAGGVIDYSVCIAALNADASSGDPS